MFCLPVKRKLISSRDRRGVFVGHEVALKASFIASSNFTLPLSHEVNQQSPSNKCITDGTDSPFCTRNAFKLRLI